MMEPSYDECHPEQTDCTSGGAVLFSSASTPPPPPSGFIGSYQHKPKKRRYSIVVFGATGNMGTKIVDFFIHYTINDRKNHQASQINWAIAGRDETKLLSTLEAIQNQIDLPGFKVETLIAEASNPQSLLSLASSTKILINCIPPNNKYEKLILRACIKAKTHYVDLSIDSNYIKNLYLNYDQQLKDRNVIVLPACGAFEVFCDVGTFISKEELEPGQICYTEGFLHLNHYNSNSNKYSFKQLFQQGDWEHLVGIYSNTLTNNKKLVLKKPQIPTEQGEFKMSIKNHKYLNEWVIPCHHSPAEQVVSISSDKSITNSYFQCGQYFSVGSLFYLIYFFLLLWFFLAMCKFSSTRRILNHFKRKSTIGTLSKAKETENYNYDYNNTYSNDGFGWSSLLSDLWGAISPSYDDPFDDYNKQYNYNMNNIRTYNGVHVSILGSGEVSPYISTSLNENLNKKVVVEIYGPDNLTYAQTSAMTTALSAILLLKKCKKYSKTFGVQTPVSLFGRELIEQLEKEGTKIELCASFINGTNNEFSSYNEFQTVDDGFEYFPYQNEEQDNDPYYL